MKLDDETLRKAFAASGDSGEPLADCAPPQRILDAVAGELSASESRSLLKHAADCPGCTVAWKMAIETVRGWQPPAQKKVDWWSQFFGSWQPLAFAAAALVLMAVGLLISIRARPPPSLAAVSLDVSVLHGAGTLRGESARPGDRLALTAQVGQSQYAELRIFREDRQLIFRCPPISPSCRREGSRLRAEAPLSSIGRYQAVLAMSQNALPPPAESFAEDSARLLKSGARIQVSAPIQVW